LRKECIYCGVTFTKENNSDEHLIPEGIGGKLSRKYLLCKECNNKTLGKFDKAIQEHISLFLNIKRIKGKRGKEVSVKGDSKLGKIIFKDGIPIVLPSVIDNADGSKIILGDKKYTEDILNGFKKKYPNLKLKERKDEALSMISLKLIDQKVWKGIGKILYLYAHFFDEDYTPKTVFFKDFLSQSEEIVPFICPLGWASRKIENLLDFPEEFKKSRNDCHLVILDYRSEENCIIGYVNFFGIGYIGIIDDNYEGDSKVLGYYVNVKSKDDKELSSLNKLNITRKDLIKLTDDWLTDESLILFKDQYSQAFQEAKLSKDIEDAFFSTAGKTGLKEGEILDEKWLEAFMEEFMASDTMKNLLKQSEKQHNEKEDQYK